MFPKLTWSHKCCDGRVPATVQFRFISEMDVKMNMVKCEPVDEITSFPLQHLIISLLHTCTDSKTYINLSSFLFLLKCIRHGRVQEEVLQWGHPDSSPSPLLGALWHWGVFYLVQRIQIPQGAHTYFHELQPHHRWDSAAVTSLNTLIQRELLDVLVVSLRRPNSCYKALCINLEHGGWKDASRKRFNFVLGLTSYGSFLPLTWLFFWTD